MSSPNPVLIQDSSKRPVAVKSHSVRQSRNGPNDSPPPLFLIHDASGLISAYFKLGPLDRPVYGLYDPKFDSNSLGGGWQDVNQMAENCIRLIKRRYPRGEIVVGGWSFGGIVATQVAHILATQGRGLWVSRIILIDTVYPLCTRPEASKEGTAQYVPGVGSLDRQTQERLMATLVRATSLADQWRVPGWTMPRPPLGAQRQMSLTLSHRPVPPPVILIRASEMVPMTDSEVKCVLDRTRILPQLGWEDMHPDFVSHVFSVQGNHYTLFDEPNVETLTATILRALHMDFEEYTGENT